jgi:hypothetical protein
MAGRNIQEELMLDATQGRRRPKYFDITDNESKLRELLWLHHGCPVHILYGDDGEMQCGNCMIDFKRDDGNQIEEKLIARPRFKEKG